MLREQLEKYVPYNEQEAQDRQIMLHITDTCDDYLLRSNETAHFTASAWIVNQSRNRVLLIHHNIYNSWTWTGGHADGEENLLQTALREAEEETGLQNLRPVDDDIFSIEIIPVNGHIRHGRYVSSHLHLNVTYLIEADEDEPLHIREDENSGAGWFRPEELDLLSEEKWMKETVYAKLRSRMEGR
jgi:8-oxo-dGTP pyrophosphatase MutT (NUDIX family)